MRKCRNWQTSKTKDLVIIAIVWVQVPSSALRSEKALRNQGFFVSVPSMALILLVKVQSRVFTAKCSEPQVGTSNGMDEGSGVTKFLSLRTET